MSQSLVVDPAGGIQEPAGPPAGPGRREPAPPAGRSPRHEQVAVTLAQLVGGAGNLVFALLAARLLDGRAFARLGSFLALYLAVHIPAGALAAAGALDPGRAAPARTRARLVGLGAAAAAALVAGAGPLASLTGLSVPLIVLLAAAVGPAPLLGWTRGRAYAAGDVPALSASLLIEPLVRLGLGLPLVLAFGAPGAAAGAVAAGWAALAALRRGRGRGRAQGGAPAPLGPARAQDRLATGTAFILLALVQNQDVVLANRLLPAAGAARFAVLSTVGAVVAFATATIPLVLLPQARRGRPAATLAAFAVATLVGGGVAAAAAVAPPWVYVAAFGDRYGGVAPLVPRYLLAMVALGLARVVVARRCARGDAAVTVAVLGTGVAVQAVLVGLVASSPGGVANATLATCAGVLGAAWLVPAGILARVRASSATSRAVAACTAVAFVLRILTDRGLWVDEAISVDLATKPMSAMLHQLRTVDVHPPLYAIVLWVTVRLFGLSEAAVRLPSTLAGTLLVPVVFGAARSLYDRRTAMVAAALATVAPILVWYSQEARMYSLFMLLAVGSVWAQVEALRSGRTRAWVAFGALGAALVLTQYFAVLVVVVEQLAVAVALVVALRRRDRARAARTARGWALALAVIAAAAVVVAPFVIDQMAAYRGRSTSPLNLPATAGASAAGDDDLSVYAALANLVWAVLGFHADRTMAKIVALWPLAMLVLLVLLGRRRRHASTYLAALAVVPATILFAVGTAKRDLFELRYFAATAPLLVILGARLLTTVTRRRLPTAAAAVMAVGLLTFALADQQLNGSNPRRYDFQGALREIDTTVRTGDVVLYAPSYLGSVVDYYGPGLDTRPVGAAPGPGRGVFVLATFRTMGERETAARVGAQLDELERDRRLVRRFDRPNVRVWEFR